MSIHAASRTLASISILDLDLVSGGAGQTFDAYSASERTRVAPEYKTIVCTGAGVKGAVDLAKGVYGAGATDNDKIRAAEMLKSYCNGGARLPSAAPKSAF